MESTANLMIFCGIRRKFYKFHGKQQNAMANLETGAELQTQPIIHILNVLYRKHAKILISNIKLNPTFKSFERLIPSIKLNPIFNFLNI